MQNHRPEDGFNAVSESNHRISNHLAMVGSLMRLHADRLRNSDEPIDGREVALILGGVSAKVEAIAQLHRRLSHADAEGGVDLGAYLEAIATSVVSSLATIGGTDLDFTFDPDVEVDPGKAMRLGLIVCELLTNTIKYAHPTGVGGRVRVSGIRAGSVLNIEIEDDGVGFPHGMNPATDGHLGFRSVRSLVAQLEATLTFSSDDLGVTCMLTVPLPAAAAAERETEPMAVVAAE